MRTHHHRLIPILAALAAAFVLPTATPPAGEMSEVAGATFHAQVVQEIAADEQQEQGCSGPSSRLPCSPIGPKTWTPCRFSSGGS